MHAAAARYVSVSELYSTDEVELLLDEIRDLEPTSCRGEDIQDFEIAGSGAGAGGAAGAGGGSGARSPAGTERSWDSHAHYSRAPPPPPRPLAPLYCSLRRLLTARAALTLFIVVCSLGSCSCVWAGAGLRVWALPGAARVRLLQLGALTSALLHGALLLLRVTRLDALLPLRWDKVGVAAHAWSGATLLGGGAGALQSLLCAPEYGAARRALLAPLLAAAALALCAGCAALGVVCAALHACVAAHGRALAAAGAGAGAGAGPGSAASGRSAYRAVPAAPPPLPSTSRQEPL